MDTDIMEELDGVIVDEVVVLSKFEGEPLPENEFERVHIKNGEILSIDTIKDKKIVSTKVVKEVI